MYCPKCGKKLNSKYRYCTNCLSSSLGIKDVETKSDRINNKNHAHKKFKVNKKNELNSHKNFNEVNKNKFNMDSSNVNGYIVAEGMSIKGGKLRKGADSSRHAQHRRWRYGY